MGFVAMKYDVFISYSRKDAAVVNSFVKSMTSAGYTIWMDIDGIETGDEFKKKIVSAIKESQVFVFFSSQVSNVSPWTVKEVNVAVNLKKTIIPIKLDNAVYDDSILFDLAGLDYIQCNKGRGDSVAVSKLIGTLKNKIGPGNASLHKVEDSEPLESQTAASGKNEVSKNFFNLLFPTGALLRIISGIEKKTFALLASAFKKNKRSFIAIILLVTVVVASFFVYDSNKNNTTDDNDVQLTEITGTINGHEWVDLGLPSGLKWATCNVGATNPWEYGGYYAWGETEEKDDYSWETYKWCNGSSNTMTKYCTDSIYGTVDNKTVLDHEDDVAHVKWGGSWRMPTSEELDELLNNCNWDWVTLNGVNGYNVTGPNGNIIFLPAAGNKSGAEFNGLATVGYYWLGSLYEFKCIRACRLNIDGSSYNGGNYNRYLGRSVRPVSE